MLVDQARHLLEQAADGNADEQSMRQGARSVLESIRAGKPAEVSEALAVLGQAFSLPHSPERILVLMTAGAAVEAGVDPTPLVAPAIEFLTRTTPLAVAFQRACPPLDRDADDPVAAFQQGAERERARSPETAAAWDDLERLFPPLIAILAASAEARARGRALAADILEMDEINAGASWLWRMLKVLDKEPILVIEPATALGLVGTMSGISSNFQLHVLLMDVFPQPGSAGGLKALVARLGVKQRRRLTQRAADIVRGTIPNQGGEPITGQWNMHAWTALQGTGQLSQGHEAEATRHWIWNEGMPVDIPVFAGYRVVVLGPASYAREFFAQRDFAHLRAGIEIERLLDSTEVNAWIGRFTGHPPV